MNQVKVNEGIRKFPFLDQKISDSIEFCASASDQYHVSKYIYNIQVDHVYV